LLQAPAEEESEAGWEVASLIGQAELPGFFDEEGEAVFVVVVAELEPCSADGLGAQSFDVVCVMKS